MRRTFVFSFFLVVFVSLLGSALGQTPPSDPEAITLAAKSVAAMSGGGTIADVTLSGTVASLMSGVPDSGTVTLTAKGYYQSRIDYVLAKKRTEVRSIASGVPQGAWTDANGLSHAYAPHNCWTEAAWFFPPLSALSRNDASIVLAYVGQENRNGMSVQHLRSYRYFANKSLRMTSRIQQLSTVDFYLDAISLLPLVITFNTHPDDDENPNLAVEVRFGDYKRFEGVMIPTHVQQSLNGSPILDVAITGASFNTNPPDVTFGLQ